MTYRFLSKGIALLAYICYDSSKQQSIKILARMANTPRLWKLAFMKQQLLDFAPDIPRLCKYCLWYNSILPHRKINCIELPESVRLIVPAH